MKAKRLYLAYTYESALGRKINKCVICNDEDEYRRMKDLIESNGLEVIEFIQVFPAKNVLSAR